MRNIPQADEYRLYSITQKIYRGHKLTEMEAWIAKDLWKKIQKTEYMSRKQYGRIRDCVALILGKTGK